MVAETWTINYEPAEGGRFTGKLTVHSDRLHFAALYESSNDVIIKSIVGAAATAAASGGHVAYIRNNSSELEVELPRAEVERVETKNSFLAKRVIVHMKDGSAFTFNYGMLSTKKLVAALGG
jgi:hypothetical protein